MLNIISKVAVMLVFAVIAIITIVGLMGEAHSASKYKCLEYKGKQVCCITYGDYTYCE